MRRWFVAAAAIATIALGPGSALAGDGVPSPRQALKDGAKALGKLDGFHVTVNAQGGTSPSPQKVKCDKALVRRDYDMEVARPLARISTPEAFWVYGTYDGALKSGQGRWVKIQADKKGKEVPHLARAVETVLLEAARHAKRSGRWLDEAESGSEWSPSDEEGESATTARERAAEGGSESGKLPTRLRVVGPWQVAERLILEVQNSGCLSGG
jgi:hypothetical protein